MLKRFAGFVRRSVGPSAILARIGGEEFVALLPCRSDVEAAAIAQQVVNGFAAIDIGGEYGEDVKATVSIGIAELGCDGDTLAELLAAADAALYRAKGSGRNRVEPA